MKNQINQTLNQHATRRQGFTFLLSCALFALCFLAQANGQTTRSDSQNRNANDVRHPLVEALEKDDPRAQLSSELRNAATLPLQSQAPSLQTEGTREPGMVEFNLRTGRETTSRGKVFTEAQQEEFRLAPVTGYQGPGASTDQRDRKVGDVHGKDGAQTESCADNSVAYHSGGVYPMSAQVKIFMRFPNGGTYQGTGVMVGSKYVLTSMNNVFQSNFGGLATQIEVIPGLDGYYKPFGSAYASYIRYYYDGHSKVGLLTLDRHIGHSTGWLGYGTFSDSYLSSAWGKQFSYPTDRDNGRVMYYNYGHLNDLNRDWLTLGATFNPGEMGAGMYLSNSYGDRYVFGVSQGTWYCGTWGSRLTEWIYGQLRYVTTNGF